MIPGQSIHQCVLECMTHVKCAGDIGWRQHDAVGGHPFRGRARRHGFEITGIIPNGVPVTFNRLGFKTFCEFHLGHADRA